MHLSDIVKKKAYYYKKSEYQLTPFQFSEDEIKLLLKVSILIKGTISEEEYELFKSITQKIQLFYD